MWSAVAGFSTNGTFVNDVEKLVHQVSFGPFLTLKTLQKQVMV